MVRGKGDDDAMDGSMQDSRLMGGLQYGLIFTASVSGMLEANPWAAISLTAVGLVASRTAELAPLLERAVARGELGIAVQTLSSSALNAVVATGAGYALGRAMNWGWGA